MNSLDRYIFKQCLTPIIASTVIITSIVWLTQSLQRVDLIVDHGSSFSLYLWLSVLIIPSLLSVVIPFALFGAALYAFHRLQTDSELAVIHAAGVSTWRICAPILLIATICAAFTLWINIDLMPRSYRMMKQEVANIRADFASSILKAGEFTTLSNRFTIYVEEVRPGGQMIGLLINDYRDRQRPETYMAKRGLLRETPNGPILYLVDGNIQRIFGEQKKIDFIKFQETAVNVTDFQNRRGQLQLELTERYLSELFHPDPDNAWDRENADKLIAEGHNRLSSPLFTFVYALLACYTMIASFYSRRGYARRIFIVCAIAGGLRIGAFLLQSLGAELQIYWLLYAVPVITIAALSYLISAPRAAWLHKIRAA